jgi:hypothetical protein
MLVLRLIKSLSDPLLVFFSNRPEIYSNGYQICFDAENDSIGYILPNWIKHENKDHEYFNWSTRICLVYH